MNWSYSCPCYIRRPRQKKNNKSNQTYTQVFKLLCVRAGVWANSIRYKCKSDTNANQYCVCFFSRFVHIQVFQYVQPGVNKKKIIIPTSNATYNFQSSLTICYTSYNHSVQRIVEQLRIISFLSSIRFRFSVPQPQKKSYQNNIETVTAGNSINVARVNKCVLIRVCALTSKPTTTRHTFFVINNFKWKVDFIVRVFL